MLLTSHCHRLVRKKMKIKTAQLRSSFRTLITWWWGKSLTTLWAMGWEEAGLEDHLSTTSQEKHSSIESLPKKVISVTTSWILFFHQQVVWAVLGTTHQKNCLHCTLTTWWIQCTHPAKQANKAHTRRPLGLLSQPLLWKQVDGTQVATVEIRLHLITIFISTKIFPRPKDQIVALEKMLVRSATTPMESRWSTQPRRSSSSSSTIIHLAATPRCLRMKQKCFEELTILQFCQLAVKTAIQWIFLAKNRQRRAC